MILKATRSRVHSLVHFLILTLVLMFGSAACAPEGGPTANSQATADHGERSVETWEMLNSQSVGAGGAAHEKAVLGIQMLDAKGGAAGECSAVLIREDAILLAAHCFDPHVLPGVTQIIVHTTHDMRSARAGDPSSRRIVRRFIHPLYNSRLQVVEGVRHPSYDNDIAVAFLNQPFTATKPQSLAETYQGLLPGMKLTSYGYGRSVDWTDSLKTAAAKRGMTRQRGTFTISSEMVGERYLTTRDSKSYVCQGDSGGPAYLIEKGKPPVVVGLNSASNGEIYVPGTNMRRCRGQSVILPVAPYRSWIDQILMENRR